MGQYDDWRFAGQDSLTFDDKIKYTTKWNRLGFLDEPNMNTNLDFLMSPSSTSRASRFYDYRITSQNTDKMGSNLSKTYRPSTADKPTSMNFLNNWSTSNTFDSLKLGLDVFNSWLAYKNYREQIKNNRFNRKLGRANYTNAAKAYNENLTSRYRARQVNKGAITSEIDRYLQENEDFRRRLVRTTL